MAALAALLSTSYQGRAVNLNHRVMHAPLSSTPGSTAWRSVPLLPTRGSSTTAKESPEDGSLCLKELSSEHVVCTVSGAGTQISCGELLMSADSALVFDSSCSGVVVSNMEIYGAHPHHQIPCCFLCLFQGTDFSMSIPTLCPRKLCLLGISDTLICTVAAAQDIVSYRHYNSTCAGMVANQSCPISQPVTGTNPVLQETC